MNPVPKGPKRHLEVAAPTGFHCAGWSGPVPPSSMGIVVGAPAGGGRPASTAQAAGAAAGPPTMAV
jgi:hypothetical protein